MNVQYISAKFFTSIVDFEVLRNYRYIVNFLSLFKIRPSGTFGYLGLRSSGTAPKILVYTARPNIIQPLSNMTIFDWTGGERGGGMDPTHLQNKGRYLRGG